VFCNIVSDICNMTLGKSVKCLAGGRMFVAGLAGGRMLVVISSRVALDFSWLCVQ
jgi:hypothetical protein